MPPPMPDPAAVAITVIILNWNGRQTLARTLEAVMAQTYTPLRVTVVDNASTDGSPDLVAERYPSVELVRLPQNLGFGRAYNQAIAAASTGLVALLNNDAYPAPGWLAVLADALAADPRAAACTSRVVLAGAGALQHTGGTLTYVGGAWDTAFGLPEAAEGGCAAGLVGAFSGAAALVRREAFVRAGGFDDRFFAYLEDVDLSWTFWRMGYRVLYAPQALVHHEYGHSGGGRFAGFRIRHAERNRIAMMVKHVDAIDLPLAVLCTLGFDLFRTVSYALRRQWGLIGALLAGTAEGLRDLPSSLTRRRALRRIATVSNRALRQTGVLVGPWSAAREYLRLEAVGDRVAPRPSL